MKTSKRQDLPLSDLEFVCCDNCGSLGQYERVEPGKFHCKVCGDEFETFACGCRKRRSAGRKDGAP